MDTELKQTLEAMAQTLAALDARVASLEASLAGIDARAAAGPLASVVAPAPEPAAPPQASAPASAEHEAVAPDILLAISAAVAAFLGERAHVKQVRLISSLAWQQQGRVNVQASHALHR